MKSFKQFVQEEGPVAANCMGDGSNVKTFDPKLGTKVLKRKKPK